MQNIERKKVMEHIGMKLTEEHVRWAALGGSILGGGGGGSAKTGAEFGDLAVRFSQLELTPLDQIDPETVVVTASMVGAPAAQEKFVSPADMMRCVELFTQSTGIRPGGIVTNENGGGSTFNGWLEASMLGIPLIDAPCNGRAHPTGVMGSLNLHRERHQIIGTDGNRTVVHLHLVRWLAILADNHTGGESVAIHVFVVADIIL